MKVYTEAGRYELTHLDTAPFCIDGKDIEIVGPPDRVCIRQVLILGSNIMVVEGKRIILRNIEFEVDCRILPFDISGHFFGVACKGCRDLTFDNCRLVLRFKIDNIDRTKPVKFDVIHMLDCTNVVVKNPSAKIEQIFPDGTLVVHVHDGDVQKLYVNDYLVTVPKLAAYQ
jgi:hypothetical protein